MEQKNFNQSNKMYRSAVSTSRMGYEKLPPGGSRTFMETQYGQMVTDNRRNFQTKQNQHLSNYSVSYTKDMNQRQAKELPSSLRSFDRSAIVEYPVDIYPKSTLDDNRINYSRQTESQLRKDNRSSVQNLDSLRNYQTNSVRSPVSSSRNEYQMNSIISNLNSEINYRRPSPEPAVRVEYRTSRNERSPDRIFKMDSRRGIWQSSPEGYRDNINSISSFSQAANIPSLFDTNLRMQLLPASSAGQGIYTRRSNSTTTTTSNLTEAERSLGYSATAPSSLTEAERSLRFRPPLNQDRARNGRGRPNSSIGNETARPLISSLGKNRFEQPVTNLRVGSRNVGTSASNTFAKPVIRPTWTQDRKRKRNIPFPVRNENKKKPKFEPPPTSIQHAAEVIKVLMDMKPTAVLSGTSLATGQISGASVTQTSVTPATPAKRKRKKKPKKKSNAVGSSPQAQPKPQPKPQPTPQPQELDVNLKDLSAIVPKNFPLRKMTVEQTTLLRNALIQEIEKMNDKSLMPDFVSCYRRRGSLMVLCNNDSGAEWLKNVVDTLEPWDGASFKVIQQGPLNFTWAAIVANEFPKKHMTPEQLTALDVALTNKMDELSEDTKPQFVDCYYRRGTLMIAYSKQKDYEWLKDTVKELQPWEGAQLRLLDMDDVPTYNKIELWVPFSPSEFDKVLARLDRQNQGLNTDDWFVLRRRGKEGGHNLVVSVGDEVIEALEKIDYKPFLNFNRITIVNSGKVKKIPFTVSEYEEDLKKLKKVKTHVVDHSKADETPGVQTKAADGDVGILK